MKGLHGRGFFSLSSIDLPENRGQMLHILRERKNSPAGKKADVILTSLLSHEKEKKGRIKESGRKGINNQAFVVIPVTESVRLDQVVERRKRR